MPLPDVCLAPHEAGELAPDEPLCAPASYRVWVWRLRWGGYYLVRPVKLSTGWRVLVARHQTRKDAPLLQLQRDERDRIATTISKSNFNRSLYLDEEGRLSSSRNQWQVQLLISTPGCPNWRANQKSSGRFKWKGTRPKEYLSAHWRATTPAKQIEREIIDMLADVNSDCAFAWRWAHLSQREQICFLLSTNEEILEECEKLLRWALWTDPLWRDESHWQWIMGFGFENSPSVSVIESKGVVLSTAIHTRIASFALSARLVQLLKSVVEGSDIRRNPEMDDKTLGPYPGGTFWRVPVPIPTQHERLEARLQLRDWLQGKVTPEEIPFLLGEAP